MMNNIDKKNNNFINDSINKLKHLYNFSKLDFFDLKVIMQNYEIKDIIKIDRDLEHDGYDRYGPKSDLWDLRIIHLENNKKYLSIWHRENWFTDVDEEYSLIKKQEIK